ncbi:MAG: Flagellar motor switch protein FliN [Chlamydiae bacterium]|nr:Flagellar motor switch protein FliN [Chlamydiota bacterium]
MEMAPPLDWIEKIDETIRELDERPQFGLPAPFPWRKLEEGLAQLFSAPTLALLSDAKGWQSQEVWEEELGEDANWIAIDWAPLTSPLFLITKKKERKELMNALLDQKEGASFFLSPNYFDPFFQYFLSEILHLVEGEPFASPLTPRIHETSSTSPPEGPCFVLDVGLKMGEKTFWGKVMIPEAFRRSWKSYFSHLPPPPLTDEERERIEVELCLEVGYTRISGEEYGKIRPGDFLLLDHCSYDPLEGKGGCILTLGDKALFRGRLKEGGVKLTEYPIYEEVREAMAEEEEEEEEEESLETSLDEDEDEELYDDLEETEEELLDSPEEETEEQAPPLFSVDDVPIHLTVEAGRVKMSAKELFALSPGSVLDLHITPEQGVDLVVGGKKVGRGELIRLGDTLGVRIHKLS